MDKNYAKSHVSMALAQKISQATVQILSKRDTYPIPFFLIVSLFFSFVGIVIIGYFYVIRYPSHLPDIIDLAAGLLTDYFSTQQRESVRILFVFVDF